MALNEWSWLQTTHTLKVRAICLRQTATPLTADRLPVHTFFASRTHTVRSLLYLGRDLRFAPCDKRITKTNELLKHGCHDRGRSDVCAHLPSPEVVSWEHTLKVPWQTSQLLLNTLTDAAEER